MSSHQFLKKNIFKYILLHTTLYGSIAGLNYGMMAKVSNPLESAIEGCCIGFAWPALVPIYGCLQILSIFPE